MKKDIAVIHPQTNVTKILRPNFLQVILQSLNKYYESFEEIFAKFYFNIKQI